jgi:hypothetical protein
MRYTLPKANYARTSDYQGTTGDYKIDADVLALKESVARNNAYVREVSRRYGRVIGTLGRVRIKGRGPRKSSSYHTQLNEATHFDVYAGEDTQAMYQLKREIDTGMTPGQLRAFDKAEYKAQLLTTIGHLQRNGKSVPDYYKEMLKGL